MTKATQGVRGLCAAVEVRTKNLAGQEPEAGTDAKSKRNTVYWLVSPQFEQTCFLVEPRTAEPKITSPDTTHNGLGHSP